MYLSEVFLAEQALAAFEYCERYGARRAQLEYDIDGMVIKVNDLALARDLGFVGKDPRGAVAPFGRTRRSTGCVPGRLPIAALAPPPRA